MGVDPSGTGGTRSPNNLVGGDEVANVPPPNNQDFHDDGEHFLEKITMTESLFEKITMTDSLFGNNRDDGEPFLKNK